MSHILHPFIYFMFLHMSRFIYLVVLKYTGRTCNAHPVIGGGVVASSWNVYLFFECLFNMYVLSYIVCLSYFLSLFVHIHENHPKLVFSCFLLLGGSLFFNLAGDGNGNGGGGPFWDHLGAILGSFCDHFYNLKNKKHGSHQTHVFFDFVCLVAVLLYLAWDGGGTILGTSWDDLIWFLLFFLIKHMKSSNMCCFLICLPRRCLFLPSQGWGGGREHFRNT